MDQSITPKIEVINEDDQIKLQIAEFEARKEMILTSNMPSFVSDPSIF
jgi:hypothetical protein